MCLFQCSLDVCRHYFCFGGFSLKKVVCVCLCFCDELIVLAQKSIFGSMCGHPVFVPFYHCNKIVFVCVCVCDVFLFLTRIAAASLIFFHEVFACPSWCGYIMPSVPVSVRVCLVLVAEMMAVYSVLILFVLFFPVAPIRGVSKCGHLSKPVRPLRLAK